MWFIFLRLQYCSAICARKLSFDQIVEPRVCQNSILFTKTESKTFACTKFDERAEDELSYGASYVNLLSGFVQWVIFNSSCCDKYYISAEKCFFSITFLLQNKLESNLLTWISWVEFLKPKTVMLRLTKVCY